MNIPDFPEFRIININDKSIIDHYLNKMQPMVCELTFNNIYSWRNTEKTKISKINNVILLIAKENDVNYFMPPLCIESKNLNKVLIDILRWLSEKQKNAEIKYVDLKFLTNIDKNNFSVIEDRPNFDYVYLSSDLAYLKGRKFDAKRNHLKKFEKNYRFVYEDINYKNVDEYLSFENEWCEIERCMNKKLMDEREAIRGMLENYKYLNLKGGIIKIGGKIEALTIGEELNRETFLVNIEKANSKYKGIYQAINQMFCTREKMNYKFINREQDLGVLGIRKAKLSYNPNKLIKKYRVLLT